MLPARGPPTRSLCNLCSAMLSRNGRIIIFSAIWSQSLIVDGWLVRTTRRCFWVLLVVTLFLMPRLSLSLSLSLCLTLSPCLSLYLSLFLSLSLSLSLLLSLYPIPVPMPYPYGLCSSPMPIPVPILILMPILILLSLSLFLSASLSLFLSLSLCLQMKIKNRRWDRWFAWTTCLWKGPRIHSICMWHYLSTSTVHRRVGLLWGWCEVGVGGQSGVRVGLVCAMTSSVFCSDNATSVT